MSVSLSLMNQWVSPQAVFQQAQIAGQKAAGDLSSDLPSDGGFKLLDEALSLAHGYKAAEPWEVRLRFVVGLVEAADANLKPVEVSRLQPPATVSKAQPSPHAS